MSVSSVSQNPEPALYGAEAEGGQSEGATSQEDQGATMLDMVLRDSILASTNDAKAWLDQLSDF